MTDYSTRQVAKQLGIGLATLSRYISAGKIPAPKSVTGGGMTVHLWTEEDIEHLRQLLPKIKNGRKTRYRKEQSGARSQESEKSKTKAKSKKKPPPRAVTTATPRAVPHKKK